MINFLSDICFSRGSHVTHATPALQWIGRLPLVVISSLILALWLGDAANAQDTDSEVQLQPLSEKDVVRYEQMLADIVVQKEDLVQLAVRVSETEGQIATIFSLRRDELWTDMFHSTLNFAKDVSKQKSNGRDVSSYHDLLLADLTVLPGEAYGAMERLRSRVVFPSPELSTEEFVVADQKLFTQMSELDEIYAALVAYVEIAEVFGLDAEEERAYMVKTVTESAANRSIFIEKAIDDVKMLQASVATLPDNTKLADWLRAVQTRVQLAARAMNDIVVLMNALGIESRQYRKQVLTVTGEITTDVLDVGIVANLAADWGKAIGSMVATEGPRLLFRLLLIALILFGFWQLSKVVQKLTRRGLNSARVRVSYLLKEMIVASVRNIVIMIGFLIALSQMGVSLGPLLAGLGIAGFIIGFALQDSLANFASGMLILLYRPFDVGDIVEAGGVRGKVKNMSLVNTTFMTRDNQRLIVPNNMIWSAVITNVTAQRTRRVDLVFGISYEDDVEKAERILLDIVDKNEAVLDDPAPIVKLFELGESSVNFNVRPWVKTEDYWDALWDLTKAVKLRFDEEGIKIPYPQRELHIQEHKPA